jgi:hypothetical protein
MPFEGNQIEERWKEENPFIIHSAEDRHPSQALGQIQEHRTHRHPWGSISRKQRLPGPGQEFVLPGTPMAGGYILAAMAQARDPGWIRARPELGGSGQDPGAFLPTSLLLQPWPATLTATQQPGV